MSTRIYESLIVSFVGKLQIRVWRTSTDPENDNMGDLIDKIEQWDKAYMFDATFVITQRQILDALADFPRVAAVEVRIGSNAIIAYNDWP